MTVKPCILPWVNFCTNPFGRSRPCGYSKFKSEKKVQNSTVEAEFNNSLYKRVRLDFLAGKWPENCERCEVMETMHPGKSKMASEELYAGLFGHLIEQTRPDGSVAHFPKQIDIRLGTVCNLKCIHCGTGNSSKWGEDLELQGKYENIQELQIDNSWVDRESDLWRNIKDNLAGIQKFNFLGGEPFASRQHGRLIDHISTTEHAKDITLHYVTNGVLLTESMIEKLKKFCVVTINISLDASGKALEFFRYPIDAEKLHEKILMLDRHATQHFAPGLQWTSSNVSMFYLDQTVRYARQFKNIEFKLCNFVDFPVQMSPQNLPNAVKDAIALKLRPHMEEIPEIDFYIQHMYKRDLWPDHGGLFLNYLDDLSRVRKIDWKANFAELHGALAGHS